MKKVLFTAIMAMVCLSLTAQTNFRELSFNDALAAAKAEKKLVFIDFKTVWCGPCKMMAKETFPTKSVGDYMNKHFVSIMIDAEKGEGVELAKTYEVKAYPTFVIVDADKKEVARTVGYKDAGSFLSELERIMDPEATPEKLKARYESGERTPKLIKTYAALLKEEAQDDRRGYKKKMDEVKKMVMDYFNGLSDAQKLSADNMFVYSGFNETIDDASAKFLANNVAKFATDQQEEVKDIVKKLYLREEYSLMSGNKTPTKELVDNLKNDVKRLNLNADGHYDNSFKLMEAYNGDDNQYMQLCKSLFNNFTQTQQSALMQSLANKFKGADEDTKKKASRIIREQLHDMDVQMLYTAVMTISEIEGKGH